MYGIYPSQIKNSAVQDTQQSALFVGGFGVVNSENPDPTTLNKYIKTHINLIDRTYTI